MYRLAVVAVQRESALQVGEMLDMFLRVPRQLVRKMTPKCMLFVGKVDQNKLRTKYSSTAPHSHNPRTNRITIAVDMHGGQAKQDEHPKPKRHNEHHVSLCRSKFCPHRDTTATVKHSTRPTTISQDPQQKIARSKQNPSLPQLSHKSTHTRFHSEDRHVAWQRFVASLVASRSCVICVCSTLHESMNARAAQHHVARSEPKPRCGTSQWD